MLNGIKAIEDQLQKGQQDIEVKQKELEQFRNQVNVPNPEPTDESLKTNYPSYFQAKQDLQKMIGFHKLLDAKIPRGVELNRSLPVNIVDIAQPPKLPASPNRFLGAVLLAVGFLSTGGGLLMLKSSRHPSCSAS
jgi:hypothetical protein